MERQGEMGKEGERDTDRHRFVVPLIYASICCFLYVR